MTSTTAAALPAAALPVTYRVDQPDPAAICAEAWVRTVRRLQELAELVNPIDVDADDIADRLPHLAVPLAVERFAAYAEVVQQRDQLADQPGPEAGVRYGELDLTASALLGELLRGHPYSPGWTAATAADAVKLAELADRYRRDAVDARRDAGRQRRQLESANAELAQLATDLARAARYWPEDVETCPHGSLEGARCPDCPGSIATPDPGQPVAPVVPLPVRRTDDEVT